MSGAVRRGRRPRQFEVVNTTPAAAAPFVPTAEARDRVVRFVARELLERYYVANPDERPAPVKSQAQLAAEERQAAREMLAALYPNVDIAELSRGAR